MTIQDRPICFGCDEPIDNSPVFAAPCDHAEHPSAVWHGLCLMTWRENLQQRIQQFQRFMATHRAYIVFEDGNDDE